MVENLTNASSSGLSTDTWGAFGLEKQGRRPFESFGLKKGIWPRAWKSRKTWNFTPWSVKTRKTWKLTSASVKITKIHTSDRERVTIRTWRHENQKKASKRVKFTSWTVKSVKSVKNVKITSCSRVKIMKSHAVNAKTRNSHPEAWKSWNTWKSILTPAWEIMWKWK